MKRYAGLSLALAVVTASCSGGHGGAALPPLQRSASGAGATAGAGTTRKAASVTAPAGWASTATQAIAPANATDLGALDPSRAIDVVLGLQLRNVSTLQNAIANGQTMSRDAFVAGYGPSADQISAVTSYLAAQGFTNVQAAPNGLLVSATGTAAAVQSAFNTTLHAFSAAGGTYFANTSPAFVPTALGGNVVAVLGLTNVPGLKPGPQQQPASGTVSLGSFAADGTATSPTPCTKNLNTTTGTAVCPRFYDPASFALAYGVGTTPAATKTEVAIFTEGDVSGAISDFRYNEKVYGLPQVPVNVLHVGTPSADTSGNGEWTLDMFAVSSTAYAPKALDLYNVPSLSFKDLTVGLNAWANDDRAPVMNASLGGCEVFPYESGDMLVGDEILVEAAAQGQTLFASTGDTGAYCGVAGVPPNGGVGGAPLVEYPAASPYATAVGGTDLFTNVDGSYLGEDAWQSGGGGVSQFEYSPSWESPAQPVGTTPVGLSFRGLPDVAADAGLETGALIYEGGTQYITGGTSLASPLQAGIYARMQSLHGNALGFAPIRYYALFGRSTPQQLNGPPETQLIGPFHDVLSGTNGLYTALPKYDYTTGLGSLDVSRLAAALQ